MLILPRIFIIICLFFSFAFSLTLDEALLLAKDSPKAKILRNDYEINRAKAFQGYGVILPNLSLSYSDTQTKLPKNPYQLPIPGIDITPPTEQRSKTTSFSGNQLLFSFSGLAAFKASNAALTLAEYSYQDALQNFELEVKKAYFDLASAANYYKLSQKLYTQAQTHAKQVEIMYQNDLISRKDLLDAKVRELEAKQNLLNSEKIYKIALAGFNTLLGQSITENVSIPTPSLEIPSDILTKNFDINQLSEYALNNKPAYLAFETLIDLAESDDLNALGESLPSLFFNYTKNRTEYEKESFTQYGGETEVKTISAGWKFFAGGSNFHKINEKRNAKEKIYEQKKLTREMLRAELENAILEVKSKASAYLTSKEQRELAEESYRLTTQSFKNGIATSTQVNDSLAQLTAAENAYIKAIYDYEYAKEKLNYTAGQKIL